MATEPSSDVRAPTVLIVDDTPDDLAVATEYLEGDGYRVVSAQGGEDAIQRAQLLRPDLILLDVTPAGIDGVGTYRQLKSDERTRDIPVIFMTSLKQNEQKVTGFDSRGVDYVTKPLRFQELLPRVRTHVTLHALQRQLQHEIAARTQAEETLRRTRDELERRVDERTAELTRLNETFLVEIAERKEAERTLRKAAGDARDLYNKASCGHHSLDKDGVFVAINDTELQWLGYTREELVGKLALPDLLTPESQPVFRENFSRFKERGWVQDLELQFVRKNGTTLPVLLNATAIKDDEGNFVMSRSTLYDITERKRVEEAFRRSQRDYEALVNTIDGIVWEVDVKTFEFLFVSQKAERLLGYPLAEWFETPNAWFKHLHPEDRDGAINFCVAETKAKRDHVFEYRMIAADGRAVWLQDSVNVMVENGEPAKLRGVMVDITERKQVEDALRRNEADLQLALDAGRLGDWKWNIVTGEIAWSARCKALYGFAPDTDINAERFLASVHPDDRDRIETALKQAVETRTDYETEKRVIWPDGSVHWNASRGRVFCNAGGQPVLMAGVSMDITERKQAEEALRHSQQLLQAIIDNSTAVIYVKDLEGRFLLVNRRFTDLFHLTREIVVGKTDHDFFPKDRADAFRVFDQKVLAAGKVLEEEEVAPQDDGLHTYISIKCPLYDAAGQPYAVCGISTDITGRKRAEDALQATMARILQQESALITLTGKESMRSDQLLTSLHRISEMSARTLDVARVSVWRYNQDRSAIRCVDLYELIEDRHSTGAELTINDCPAYFQALAGCDVIAADDAQNEPRTCEFSANYLKPLGITSMMDAPIQLRGVLDGVVCHEHLGPPRKWTSDERTFVIAIANLVSLALEESERRQAEAQIKSSLKEKELLLKEVHHRVKNNLQVVSSLLNWQASYIEDASARSIFKDSQNRVRSMALIHEKLYQSDDLAHIDFGRYAQSLTASLFHSYGVDANRVRLESTIDDASLDIDKAIPCGMVLNELVSNALKHAFPNGRSGEIHVELRPCAPDHLTLIVSDDGVGLPAELNVHATQSLGLQLVVTLTEQLRGNVEVNRNSGTQFQITFPVAKSKEKN